MSVIMSKIRSSAEVWLIGKGTEKLPGSHLPTNADILQCLMFFHVQGKSPLKEAAALTVSKVSKACLSKLNNWGLQNRVCEIVFYTTASNTSLKNGACTLIENSLQQELAWVTCHHHVMELPLAAVFSISFGPTGGPHVAVFRRFQQTWPSVLAWSTSGYPSTTQWSTITRGAKKISKLFEWFGKGCLDCIVQASLIHSGSFSRPVAVWWQDWSGCEMTDGNKPLPSTIHPFCETPWLSSWTLQLYCY